MYTRSLVEQLRERALEADELHERSRRVLIEAARAGATAGLTQREISAAIGRSQPEVSRLLRFHGDTPLARSIESNRRSLLATLRAAGARNVRVFGSVSRGEDGPDSDVDLLVDFESTPSLFDLARLEASLSELVGTHVDVVPAGSLRPNVAERALADAVPL